jgi:hypothetical protein
MRDLLDFYTNAPLLELGAEADRVRQQLHPHSTVTYIVDRNINYTNVCVADCGFCAFYRRPKHNEGWTLSYEQIGSKIDEAKQLGAAQILMQGGHNPYIPFEWYLELLRYIKKYHTIHIHGFSPSEVDFFAKVFRMDARDVGELGVPRGEVRLRLPHVLEEELRERDARHRAAREEYALAGELLRGDAREEHHAAHGPVRCDAEIGQEQITRRVARVLDRGDDADVELPLGHERVQLTRISGYERARGSEGNDAAIDSSVDREAVDVANAPDAHVRPPRRPAYRRCGWCCRASRAPRERGPRRG